MTFQNRILRYGVKPADQFLANPANPRIHPQFQRQVMEAALSTVGFVAPVIETSDGYLLDGHERIFQALANNSEVPYVVLDIDSSDDDAAYVLATFDPITSLATYDTNKLDELLKEVNSDNAAIQQMLSQLAEDAGLYGNGSEQAQGDPGAQLNRAEELREKYGVERGQIWVIGRHRVMCGDSYSAADIERLMNDEKAAMLHTDPPYGINIVKPKSGGSAADSGGAKPFGSSASAARTGKSAVAFRNSGKVGGGRGDLLRHHARPSAERGHVQHGNPSKNQWAKNHPEYLVMHGDNVGRGDPSNIIQSNLYPIIEGDDRPFDPAPFIDFAPVVILWGANYYADKLPIKSCWIAWDKREDITRNNFADCELAWTNQDSPSRLFHHLWNGLHKGSQNGERRIHPTEKPVALFEEIGKMFCPDGIWVDLFAGSGAQIVAAERAGTTCYALEYEPLYVACMIDRLERMGLTPQLEANNG